MFERSECLQKVAIKLRDESLCQEVRERKSIFFDGSGISQRVCLRKVREKIREDRVYAGSITDIQHLKGVTFSINANGRDLDMKVTTRGRYGHPYRLRVVCSGKEGVAVIYDRRVPLAGSGQSLSLFLRTRELKRKLGHCWHDGLELRSVLSPEPSGRDEEFIFSHIPFSEKTSSVTTTVNFSKLFHGNRFHKEERR
ncbi:MAG: hypothetical protein P8013_07480 [Candidatus Sulfobium sp.]|jgi:hypothetical protein